MIELTDTEILYNNCRGLKVKNHRVSHGKLYALNRTMKELIESLGDRKNDHFWIRPLMILNNYFFTSIWAPVPHNDILLIDPEQLGCLYETLDRVKDTFPNQTQNFHECCDSLQILYDAGENPLFDCMVKLIKNELQPDQRLIVLVRKQGAFEAITEALKFSMTEGEIPEIQFDVITAHELKSVESAQTILILGPLRYYLKRSYVFGSPKFNYVHTVNHAWFNDRVMTNNSFNGSLGGPPRIEDDGHVSYGEKLDIKVSEEDPTDPVLDVAKEPIKGSTEKSDVQVEVTARFFLLESNYAVWLQDSDEKFSYIVNPDKNTTNDESYAVSELIERRPNVSVQEGEYLVLRQRGQGDYISDYADTILGETAQKMRATQEIWKVLLWRKVRESSTFEVSVQLLDLGSQIANESNVRSWMSSDRIKTRKREDFSAIMKLVDLEKHEPKLWENASTISRAHHRAGQKIRHDLFRAMRNVDISRLEKSGLEEINLDDENVGNLTIIRVVERTDILQEISISELSSIHSIRV